MSKLFFSIITPTYNRAGFLPKTIKSVTGQTHPHFEWIIIDDGSSDNTKQLIDDAQDERIKYVAQDNRGPSHARNSGIKLATNDWIAFVDSDDVWMEEKLTRAAQAIEDFEDIKIFHTQETWFRHGKLFKKSGMYEKPDGWVYQQVLPVCCISVSTAVVHKSIFEAIGMFDESMPVCEDYDFWLRCTCQYPVKLIDEALTEKEGGRPDQLSSQWGLDRYRITALEKQLNNAQLSKDDYDATLYTFKRKCDIFRKGAQKRGRTQEADQYQSLIQQYV